MGPKNMKSVPQKDRKISHKMVSYGIYPKFLQTISHSDIILQICGELPVK